MPGKKLPCYTLSIDTNCTYLFTHFVEYLNHTILFYKRKVWKFKKREALETAPKKAEMNWLQRSKIDCTFASE